MRTNTHKHLKKPKLCSTRGRTNNWVDLVQLLLYFHGKYLVCVHSRFYSQFWQLGKLSLSHQESPASAIYILHVVLILGQARSGAQTHQYDQNEKQLTMDACILMVL